MGGTRSQLDKKNVRQINLQAQRLPGKLNATADFLSRYLRETFSELSIKVWGPLQVDLFATRFSTRLQRFFS